jgi:hypothetical protein
MRKYITLFFSVTFFLFSCEGDKAPSGIIVHDRMISLLTEVHLVDGGMYSVSQNPDSLYKYGTDRYLTLFKKYHTDSVQFRKSLQYYATQPSELQTIYEMVQEELKNKNDSLNKIQLSDNKKADSLNKIMLKNPRLADSLHKTQIKNALSPK